MKKIIIFIACGLIAASLLSLGAFAGRFDDVADGKWYTDGINFCVANGYMDGISEREFDRGSVLTRAMFMTVLAKVDGADLTGYEGKSSFTDVKTDGWYTPAIEWAYQNKLASGIAEDTFGYKNAVTREQMALFLYSYAEYVNSKALPEVEPMPEPPVDGSAEDMPEEIDALDESFHINITLRADLSVFKDADRVHSWAKDAMEWAVACELFSGVDENILDPRGNCTRAQTAVLVRAFVLNFLTDCEHDWEEPTCLVGGICNLCELYHAPALGHELGDRICTEDTECLRCGVTVEGTTHKYAVATCILPRICGECGHTDGDPLGHTVPNGYCTRCKSDNFTDAHSRLLYYLNKNGTADGDILYFTNPYVTEPASMKNQKYTVYTVKGDSSVYLQFSYNSDDGGLYVIEMELSDIDHPFYHFIDFYINSGGIYSYCRAGTVYTKYLDSNGSCYIDDAEYGNKDYYRYPDNSTIPRMFFHCSRLMQVYAGVNLSEYGFNMAEITKKFY